jgi:hypothetical protein
VPGIVGCAASYLLLQLMSGGFGFVLFYYLCVPAL